ncbi:hypothetical protein IAD21_04786 [Abditibacteriota bacterium]|nr:hypothetical protein IAD21_04786 [Abditibacteriota bacterium]
MLRGFPGGIKPPHPGLCPKCPPGHAARAFQGSKHLYHTSWRHVNQEGEITKGRANSAAFSVGRRVAYKPNCHRFHNERGTLYCLPAPNRLVPSVTTFHLPLTLWSNTEMGSSP